MGLPSRDMDKGEDDQRVIDFGRPEQHPPFADNSVTTSKYTILSFFPLSIRQQFRRNGNVYFLVIGILMFIGYYTPLFSSSITPWTTLGPLALVISVSLAQEAYTDIQRHRSDNATNRHLCVVLRRADELNQHENRTRDTTVNEGNDVPVKIKSQTDKVPIAFESVQRSNMYAGDIVVVRNRELLPVDLILLASSNEGGSAYIETSSIDGETNLKLRNSPHLPANRPDAPKGQSNDSLFNGGHENSTSPNAETLEHAIERIANMSLLGHPDGVSASLNPANSDEQPMPHPRSRRVSRKGMFELFSEAKRDFQDSQIVAPKVGDSVSYIATLTSEPPNTHVNNYTGKLTLPPMSEGGRSEHVPLNAENILLRGAVLRNTDWVIGVACFTGADTKLVMNSVATPSKFSQLDMMINRTVVFILMIMIICVLSLGGLSVSTSNAEFDKLWYVGLNKDLSEPWPYFNLESSAHIGTPSWDNTVPNYLQAVFMFVTMLSNFVPLSLYVSVEMVTLMMMLYIGWDLHMYHKESDTPAIARSTIVTDLGLVEYIFSDKTGTLTCNVMEFKRCSVDGHVFGMPIAKAAPGQVKRAESMLPDSVHPLKNLLACSENTDGSKSSEAKGDAAAQLFVEGIGKKLSFNAEMFLRVMSICHTVVVEKDHKATESEKGSNNSAKKSKWLKSKKNSEANASNGINDMESIKDASHKDQSKSKKRDGPSKPKKKDGAPEGSAYQAESPDEGALVAAASHEYGFQLIGRDSSGVQVSCPCPSLFEDANIIEGIKNGTLTAKSLAAQTNSTSGDSSKYSDPELKTVDECSSPRTETWSILAINKFDSDRKRMSVLVRSPPELGSIPMLLCKGADSSMLLRGVCEGFDLLEQVENTQSRPDTREVEDHCEVTALLGLQSHLGEFASEGLRTLVLGVKILSEEETVTWLSKFKEASTSIENRDKRLTAVAYDIEKNLHIVGATAIEDRLQDGVPETIANLGKAGIKLWVLTGDKRETAIEIGYSTKVLSPKMHLTEVIDGPPQKVKTLLAMELMRHIKIGNLPDYQLASLDEPKRFSLRSLLNLVPLMKHSWKKLWFAWRQFYLSNVKGLWTSKAVLQDYLDELETFKEAEKRRVDPRVQRRKVRECALAIIKEFWNDPDNQALKDRYVRDHGSHDESSVIDADEPPAVFERAKSARASLKSFRQIDPMRQLALATVTESQDVLFDEEALSLQSFRHNNATSNFDKSKRTVMERLFAVDSDVRHGRLSKHVKDEYKEALALESRDHAEDRNHVPFDVRAVKRGLVVEGAALKHLLGDPLLEEMLFAVASCSQSVIACRVSPIQKALLLKMVRKYVSPTPTTLAIGDGANDVGMIQEAHIGIGISGLEGQQAVNASDFAIAQFRYLESLLLIHGRWNFMRMSKTILFFFYKNATLIGILMVFSGKCLFSGTPIFDPWVIAVFNFVGGSIPIIFMALFDRDLPRNYVIDHPEVYQSGPNNEFLSLRMTLRWVFITIIQTFTIYYFTAPVLYLGGGVTSAFKGLMGNWGRDIPGDGEGSDLQIFGTTVYSNLIYAVTLKAFFETRSLICGEFPTFTCRRGNGEGWPNRMGYTWVGVSWGSVIFYIWFLYMYELIGRRGVSSFFGFIYVTNHLLNMRSITWMLSILAPTIACILDVSGKVIGNMYYPTQTQIHAEIACQERKQKTS
ncbi:hypothetical protein HJC23_009911 [Cyclotella cryptica]|uniref:P-type phospholipid transporter n=1 Tax=Cyclotella cryptica TaxID=29204 RepID=A0ABD3QB27_9STRA